MGAFFHAVGVFFQHLADVKWEALGLALACQVVKLGFRSYAWRSILLAAYPAQRLKHRTVFGAYVAGVGVNAVVPARAGDVVKMYLVKQRLQDASYATLAPTLVVETLFDFVVATGLLIWALSLGVLPTNQVYSKLPSVDWQFFVRHDRLSLVLLVALFVAALVGIVWARMRWREFKRRVGMGFAILRDRPRFLRARDRPAGDLLGVSRRRPVLLPAGVRRPREPAQRAAGPGGRLAGDAVPGDARTAPARSRG